MAAGPWPAPPAAPRPRRRKEDEAPIRLRPAETRSLKPASNTRAPRRARAAHLCVEQDIGGPPTFRERCRHAATRVERARDTNRAQPSAREGSRRLPQPAASSPCHWAPIPIVSGKNRTHLRYDPHPCVDPFSDPAGPRSEEHTSELQSREN